MGKEPPYPRTEWRAIGQSVRGAAHLRTGLPNQDAIRWLPASGTGPPLILAVSDGHGSPRYFRSHVGSEKAVETAAWVVQDLLDGQPDPGNLSAIKRTAEDRLPQTIVRRWEQAVAEHIAQSPLTPDELGTLEQQKGVAARQAVADNPVLAYGATVLAVLVAETFILYLQLGDGDILVVAEDGQVSRPLERDTRLFANQTTSLCTTDAWRDVQVHFQALVDPPPALILLATDGYANSFVNEAAFRQVGTDILEMIRAEGLEAVQGSLETWLTEASQAGSGDDITLGILCRADVPSSSQSETSELKTAKTDIALGEEDEFTVTVTVKRAKK
jgi:serine/threonine protein phosphatase PrpC